MDIFTFVSPPFATNVYVVCRGKDALLIDAGMNALAMIRPLLEERRMNLLSVLLTHSHFDHTAGLAELQTSFNVKTWVHPFDRENLVRPGADGLPFVIKVAPANAECLFEDKQMLRCGPFELQVLHTPGHSPGSCCFYFEKEKMLFSGDTLFANGYGNVSFPTSSPRAMRESLHKLAELPSETRVYPGHGETTTIGAERLNGILF